MRDQFHKSGGGILKSTSKTILGTSNVLNHQEQLNNSVSPANNTNSFINGSGLAPANDKAYGTTIRNLDTSYEDRYGATNISSKASW